MTRAFSSRSAKVKDKVKKGVSKWAQRELSLLTGLNIGTGQLAHGAEVNTDEFTESGGVVVTHGLGVTKSLKHRVSLHDLIFQVALNSGGGGGGSERKGESKQCHKRVVGVSKRGC